MKSKMQPREGWWFSDNSGVLPRGDGRPIIIGQKLSVKGKLVICQNALHGSFDPFDAFQYAPGSILHKVLFSGARIEESDKVGSRSRTVIATRDATDMLKLFARRQALSVIHMWDAPVIVREYLETGDETKRDAAADAADDVAHGAADAYAYAAAYSAAYAADADAAGAARHAAYAAARYAAHGAARHAAHGAYAYADADARYAARYAACHAARQMFNDMVAELFNGLWSF